MYYSENERKEIIKFIEENFGKIELIYQNVGINDFYLDVAQINPTKKYYTLMALGMEILPPTVLFYFMK